MSTDSPPRQWEGRLGEALTAALEPLRSRVGCALLFSGGVDSGLLAWELRSAPGLTLATIGREGSSDLVAAERASEELGLGWTAAVLTDSEVLAMAHRIEPETRGLSPTARAVEVAMALAVARAPPGVVACGQGADELFYGYAHLRGSGAPESDRRADEDLQRLMSEAWPRSRRIAHTMGRELVAPYLAPEFLVAARRIPAAERRAGPAPKQAFRTFAQHRGLPRSIAERPKKALQFGTGVDRLLRRSETCVRGPT
jgi:asparagine synthase (glutamine-hydrolysing)